MDFKKTLALISLVAVSAASVAQVQTFKIGGVDARQQVSWESVSSLETMVGRTHKITGAVQFDPKAKTGKASIIVDAASMKTGIDLRDEHMRSEQWLDTKKFPEIKFETTKVEHKSGDKYKVTGNFTMHGVTKVVTTEATVKYFAESATTKSARFEGNVVQIKSNFKIKMSDYGIKVPDTLGAKVSNSLSIVLDVFASTK